MNNKGQMNVGIIIIVFIGVLVGLILLTTIASDVGSITQTRSVVNDTITAAAGGTSQNLLGQAVVGSVTVVNSTSGTEISNTLYTVKNNQVVNGLLTATITRNETGLDTASEWKATYTYEPEGYVGGAGKSMALLIPVMFALAILAIAMYPVLKSGMIDFVGR
jgi:hypothetical protein